MRVVDFWVQNALEGYIIELMTEGHQSFCNVEVLFKSELWGKILKEILLWIKFLRVEENLLGFQKPPMVA